VQEAYGTGYALFLVAASNVEAATFFFLDNLPCCKEYGPYKVNSILCQYLDFAMYGAWGIVQFVALLA